MFTINRVFKHKEVVSNLHFCSNGPWKMWPSYTFHFSARILHPHIRKYLIFFRIVYVEMSNNQYSALDNVKMTSKHISIKVSLKITLRKKNVYIEIGWPWIWNQCFYLWIWNDDRTNVIVLPSFHFATRFNSQNANETEIIYEFWHINFLWIFVIPNGIIEVST